MAGTLTNLIYHIIFSTKDREAMLAPESRADLFKYFGGIIKGEGGILLEAGGIADHVHLAVKLKPANALSEIMKKVKDEYKEFLKRHNVEYNEDYLWD
ncbi:MAG: IS200/IS605 family transposase [Planctomycetota bacterium]|jgi:REP element-mobilizing transposase RayT